MFKLFDKGFFELSSNNEISKPLERDKTDIADKSNLIAADISLLNEKYREYLEKLSITSSADEYATFKLFNKKNFNDPLYYLTASQVEQKDEYKGFYLRFSYLRHFLEKIKFDKRDIN